MCSDTVAGWRDAHAASIKARRARPIARFRDPALPTAAATRVLRRNQSDERRQLPRVVKAREIAELGDNGERDEELDAAQSLQRLDDWIEVPRGRALEEFGIDPLDPIDLFIDRSDRFLKHDLLRRCRTHHLREVAAVGVVPGRSPDVVPPQAKQERLQSQLRVLPRDPRGVPGATEVAEGFVLDRRHVDGREIPGAQQPCEFDGISAIGLTLSPGFFRINDGATTWQVRPLPVRYRCSTYPHGPASYANVSADAFSCNR